MFTTDFISSSEAGNLTGLLRCRAARSPDAIAYRQYDNNSELWQTFTWRQVEEEIVRWRGAIANAELKPGDRGTVDFVDDMGTIHVTWDNGSTLGMVPGEDQYRFVNE